MKSNNTTGFMSFVSNNKQTLIILIISIAALLFPMVNTSLYLIRVLIVIGIYAILALSLNIVTGYAGILSMGHAAFFAVGAYVGTLLMKNLGMSFFLASLIAAAFAGFSGFLLGLPTLRLTGAYLVMVTIGFAEIVRMITLNWDSLTNGALGIKNIPAPTVFGYQLTTTNNGIYYLMLFSLAIVMFICYAIKFSKMGRALRAIKDDELAVSLMGINNNRYKIAAFVISASIAGYIGAFYASMLGYIDPFTFTTDMSTLILCMVLLGGMGSIWGMLLASGLLIAFPEVLRFLSDYRFVVYGFLLIIIMRYQPDGLFGRPSRKPYKLPKGVVMNKVGDDINVNA